MCKRLDLCGAGKCVYRHRCVPAVLSYEFVDGVDECFGRGADDVGVGRESVILVAVVFDCHVHFANVVAAFVDGLDKEFLDKHLAAYDELDCRYCRIDGTVARSACLEFFSRDVESDTCHRLDADS